VERSDVVVVELRVEPHDVGEVPDGAGGAGIVPVDEGDRVSAAGEDVPGPEVTVPDDSSFGGQRSGGGRERERQVSDTVLATSCWWT
jgi:hypothetical protein